MPISSKLKGGLLVSAILAYAAVVLKVLLRASVDEQEPNRSDPAPDYEAAMDELNPVCLSKLLTHGHKTEHAIILKHSMTNCPEQFRELAPMFYERGYNVLIPVLATWHICSRKVTIKTKDGEVKSDFFERMC